MFLLSKNATSDFNRKDIATGPFIMRSPKMSTYSQQLWVIAKLYTENTDGMYCCCLFTSRKPKYEINKYALK